MPTYTTNLQLQKLLTQQTQKEGTVNGDLDAIDAAISGVLTKAVTGGTVALTPTEAGNSIWILTGTLTSNLTLKFPSNTAPGKRAPLVVNSTTGAFTVTVSPFSGGAGVAVTQGKSKFVYFDGANVADAVTDTSTAYAVRAYNSAAITVPSATPTILTFDSERRDDGGLHSMASNTSRLTAPVAGWYSIFATLTFQFNATGFRAANIKLNGTTIISGLEFPAISTSTEGTLLAPATLYYLNANDYVEISCYQDSGVSLNVSVLANYSPEFGMIKVG
jgi:hypothetical protein